ncbi:MAG: ribosome maturation factor RimP [Pseudomonadota bacterium]|jgi:ribosome maturation factor RimP
MSSSLKDQLLGLAEPLVAGLGYELVDVEYLPGRSSAMVRVYIDWPGGVAPDGVGSPDDESRAFEGIGVDDCERVSREFSALLDVEDPLPGAYTLEVSSPGLDRILRTPAHFARFVGERVHVELLVARDGRRRYTGRLVSSDASNIELEVDGQPVALAIAGIGRARLAPDWSRPPLRR